MRISDWSSDVCSSDLREAACAVITQELHHILNRDLTFRILEHGRIFREYLLLPLLEALLCLCRVNFLRFRRLSGFLRLALKGLQFTLRRLLDFLDALGEVSL